MQLSPTTLASLRRTAAGTAIVAAGLLGGVAAAQDGRDPAPNSTSTTVASATSTSAAAEPGAIEVEQGPAVPTTGPEAAPTTTTTSIPAFDPDDCPACGMG